LIVSREAELVAQGGNVSSGKPRFVDEPSGNVIVQLKGGSKSDNKKQK